MNPYKGAILMLTLVMTSVFVVASLGLASLAIGQNKLANQKTAWHNALNIAEAGFHTASPGGGCKLRPLGWSWL